MLCRLHEFKIHPTEPKFHMFNVEDEIYVQNDMTYIISEGKIGQDGLV